MKEEREGEVRTATTGSNKWGAEVSAEEVSVRGALECALIS